MILLTTQGLSEGRAVIRDATVTWLSDAGAVRTGDFRVYAPTVTDVPVLRGLILILPGSAGDWRFRAEDVVWQEAARSLGFAVIGWGERDIPWRMPETEARRALDAILGDAANAVGRPELVNAPLVVTGFSWGAFVSTDLACRVPDRIIAAVTHRGGSEFDAPSPAAARKVPVLWIPGSADTNPVTNPSLLAQDYLTFRGTSAPDGRAAFAVDWRTPHDAFTNQGWSMAWTWIAEAIALRYPPGELPSTVPGHPLVLRDIALEAGWLGQRAYLTSGSGADRSAFAAIAPYADYAAAAADASWLPNETVARVYRAFNSHDGAARGVVPLQGPLALVGDAAPGTIIQGGQSNLPQLAVWPAGATLTLRVDPREFDDLVAIASMEFHDGAQLIGTLTAPGPAGWTVSHTLATAGIHSLTVVATDVAGTRRAAFRTVVAAPPRLAPEPPLVELKFDGAGDASPGSGTDPVVASLLDAAGAPADLHGPPGGGLTGRAWDRAFDNGGATGMGSAGTGGGASLGDLGSVEALNSLTLQGWFKASAPLNNVARLLDKNSGTGNSGFVLRGTGTPGQLVLQLNSASALSAAAYGAAGQWVFFAVTYDAYRSADNVRFYVGSATSPVVPAGVGTINAGSVAANTLKLNNVPLVIGNNTSLSGFVNSRPFDGQLDNIRVYGASAGTRGVLTASELESLRQGDLEAGTPPPLAFGLVDSRPELRWPSRVGRSYGVQRSLTLGEGGWTDLATPLDGLDGELRFLDPEPMDGPRVFYRLQVNR